jgi:hypothetical protein
MRQYLLVLPIFILLAAIPVGAKNKKEVPPGVIAASAGEVVVLADPDRAWEVEFDTGTVGWLFPAPSGIVFAPDLIRGQTTVLDLRGRRVMDRFEGVTMPHFGTSPDRYVVVAGDLMVMSYPDRALISRVQIDVSNPWQVISANQDTVVIVLARRPESDSEATLVAVDLISGRMAYRRQLTGDVRRMSLSVDLGLLALADATTSVIQLFDPSILSPVAALQVTGRAVDVAFLPDGGGLVAAAVDSTGSGEVRMWVLKRKGGEIKVKKEYHVGLPSPPVRLATSPAGVPRVAVGLASGHIVVVDLENETIERTIELPGEPRDVVWVDPLKEGPMLPEWSDKSPGEIEIGRPRR